jgi:hypothetical protein
VIILTPRPLYHGKEHLVAMKLGATWSLESVRVLGKRNTFAGSGIQTKAVKFVTISHTRYACSLLHSIVKYALLLTTVNKILGWWGGLRCQEKIRKWRHLMNGNWRKLQIHKVNNWYFVVYITIIKTKVLMLDLKPVPCSKCCIFWVNHRRFGTLRLCVPNRRHVKFRWRGFTQKKEHNNGVDNHAKHSR